ncbi:MAG: FixH family protein [Gammaproteobacteria bacterium]|nr:FixH family protein [Gammaproteobacteria bacterium]
MITDTQLLSWKNQPYVWMLILIPMSAVIMGVVMITLAINSDSGLVVDDYYKKGKQINKVIARDRMAASMSLSANIEFNMDSKNIDVIFLTYNWQSNNEVITLGLYHATRPGMDQFLTLQKVDDYLFSARYTPLDPGRWKIQLATESWRLVGSLHRPGGNSLQLTAFLSE